MVKYGDIGKDSTNVFSDDYLKKVKVVDKIKVQDDVLAKQLRWDDGIGAKLCYKWLVGSDVKGDATLDLSQAGMQPSLVLTKGPATATFKSETKETFAELAVKENCLGGNVGGSIKAAVLPEMKHSGSLYAAWAHTLTKSLTLEFGAKVKVDGMEPKPEAAVGLNWPKDSIAVKWDHAKNQITLSSLFSGPANLFGLAWSYGTLVAVSEKGALLEPNSAVTIQAKKGKDLTVKAKFEKLTTTPEPTVSIIANHKPIEGSKEQVTLIGTCGYTAKKGVSFGFSATRA